MNQRATLQTSNAPTASTVAPSADGAVRPKVMRRPAQFSTPASNLRVPPTLPLEQRLDAALREPAAPAVQATPSARAWQDDGRFAVALLAIVIVVNVAVSIWLSAMSPPAVAPAASPEIAAAPATDTLIHELSAAGAAATEQ